MASTSLTNASTVTSYIQQVTTTDTTTYDVSGGTANLAIDGGSSQEHCKIMGVTIQADTLDDTDSTTLLQGSMDGTTWVDIGAASTISNINGSTSHTESNTPWKRFRVTWTAGSVSSGDLTLTAVYKQ